MKSIIMALVLLILPLSSSAYELEQGNNLYLSKIVFAVPEAYFPYSMLDASGHVNGFSVTFATMICKELKTQCIFKPMLFKDFFQAVAKGTVDAALGAITITPERLKSFAFTVPYLPSRISIMAKTQTDKPNIQRMTSESARNKIFAIQTGSAFAKPMEQLYPLLKIKSYDTDSDLVEALAQSDVDYILLDSPTAYYWQNHSAERVYVVGKPYMLQSGIGIMLKKGNYELQQALNRAIIRVKNMPEFTELLSMFFPNSLVKGM